MVEERPFSLGHPIGANLVSRAFAPVVIVLASLGGVAAQQQGVVALPALSAGSTSDDSGDLAKQLANPVADLVSLPLQSNLDYRGGAQRSGSQYRGADDDCSICLGSRSMPTFAAQRRASQNPAHARPRLLFGAR